MTIYAGDAPSLGSNAQLVAYHPTWLQLHGTEVVFCFWLVVVLGAALAVWKYRAALLNKSRYRLATPLSRLGFTIIVCALCVFAASWLGALADGAGDRFYRTVLTFDGYAYYWWQHAGRWAIGAALVGAWLTWAYRPTVGRLIQWIRHG